MVHTSNLPGAGTGGGVWVDLEGLAGSSGPQDLPSGPLAFERGQVIIHPSNRGCIKMTSCKAFCLHDVPVFPARSCPNVSGPALHTAYGHMKDPACTWLCTSWKHFCEWYVTVNIISNHRLVGTSLHGSSFGMNRWGAGRTLAGM